MSNQVGANEHHRPQRRATDFVGQEERQHRSSANSQMSLSPGHWKKYIAHEDLLRKPTNRSNNESRPYGSPQRTENSQYKVENTNLRAQHAKKDEMLRRMK